MIGRILAAVVREWSDTDKLQGYYVLLVSHFFSTVQFSNVFTNIVVKKERGICVTAGQCTFVCSVGYFKLSFLVR